MIKPYCPSQYIAGTDVGKTELDMAVFAHEIGDMRACTGKPQELGGISRTGNNWIRCEC